MIKYIVLVLLVSCTASPPDRPLAVESASSVPAGRAYAIEGKIWWGASDEEACSAIAAISCRSEGTQCLEVTHGLCCRNWDCVTALVVMPSQSAWDETWARCDGGDAAACLVVTP